MLAASPRLSGAYDQLFLVPDEMQGQPMVASIDENPTQLGQEPERVSGLPMNAQIILE